MVNGNFSNDEPLNFLQQNDKSSPQIFYEFLIFLLFFLLIILFTFVVNGSSARQLNLKDEVEKRKDATNSLNHLQQFAWFAVLEIVLVKFFLLVNFLNEKRRKLLKCSRFTISLDLRKFLKVCGGNHS
jgi:hypothetical protein